MEFFDVLVRYEVDLWAVVDDDLRRRGLISAAQLQALDVLSGRDGTGRVQDVSGGIGITVGAASKLVDRLERDGLVERRPNPSDRRSSLVVLTNVGQAAFRAATQARAALLDVVLEPDATRAALIALKSLQDRLDRTRSAVVA
jgi:DNA-binding MarR family transcriptional regulator